MSAPTITRPTEALCKTMANEIARRLTESLYDVPFHFEEKVNSTEIRWFAVTDDLQYDPAWMEQFVAETSATLAKSVRRIVGYEGVQFIPMETPDCVIHSSSEPQEAGGPLVRIVADHDVSKFRMAVRADVMIVVRPGNGRATQ